MLAHDDVSVEFDEYLWPLTDAAWPLNLTRMAEEHRLRARLDEILVHVETTHIAPRVRRLGARATPAAVAEIRQSVIAGPAEGAYWERALREPVPRSLREAWDEMSQQLRDVMHPAPRARRAHER
jgi:hypothetical protein